MRVVCVKCEVWVGQWNVDVIAVVEKDGSGWPGVERSEPGVC